MMRRTGLAMLMITAAMGTSPLRAANLSPGSTIEFRVEGVPPSLADLFRNNRIEPALLTVRLPLTYNREKDFPILVFLSGGDGGTGGELHQAEPFLGGTDYILVNFPQYKAVLDGETVDKQLTITPYDTTYATGAIKMILDALDEEIPNIDRSRSIFAGFSNGANTAGLVLRSGDQDLLDRFSLFILIEGGFWMAPDQAGPAERPDPEANLAGAAGKRVLIMHGDQTDPPDRIPWNADARKSFEALLKAGVQATLQPMTNVGHDFPPAEMAVAREWVETSKPKPSKSPIK